MTPHRSSRRLRFVIAAVLVATVSALGIATALADDGTPPGCDDLTACVAQTDTDADPAGEDASGDGSVTDSGTSEPAPPVEQPDGTPVVVTVTTAQAPSTGSMPTSTPTTTTPEAPASAVATTVPVVPEATPDPKPAPRPPGFCDLTPTADVGVRVSVAGGDVVQGSMVSYSLDVFNSQSPDCSAPSASLSDQLPPQLELPSADAVTTEQGSCRVEGGVGNQHIICSFGTLEAGQHVKVGITARVDKTGSVSDQACVDSSATDPNRGDNQCSTAVFTVTPAASSNTSTQQPSAPVKQPAPRDQATRMPSHLRLPDTPPKKELPRTLVLPE